MEFFEKNWKRLAEGKPAVAIIPKIKYCSDDSKFLYAQPDFDQFSKDMERYGDKNIQSTTVTHLIRQLWEQGTSEINTGLEVNIPAKDITLIKLPRPTHL